MNKKNEFSPPNDEELIEILKILNDSDFDELRLEMSGLGVSFSKHPMDLPDQSIEGTIKERRGPSAREESVAAEDIQEFKADAVPAQRALSKPEAQAEIPLEEEGLIPIKSPLLGIFYRSPKPGSPPFVETGSEVTEDDTVCLVEVMKLFNTVKAGVRGRIAKICAENNQMIEYNQTLFLIEPKIDQAESPDA